MTAKKELVEYINEHRESCHATYNGGHHEEETYEAFHHGMDTVFNCLEGYLADKIIQRFGVPTEIEWPIKFDRQGLMPLQDGFADGWDEAIDACKQAYAKARGLEEK